MCTWGPIIGSQEIQQKGITLKWKLHFSGNCTLMEQKGMFFCFLLSTFDKNINSTIYKKDEIDEKDEIDKKDEIDENVKIDKNVKFYEPVNFQKPPPPPPSQVCWTQKKFEESERIPKKRESERMRIITGNNLSNSEESSLPCTVAFAVNKSLKMSLFR